MPAAPKEVGPTQRPPPRGCSKLLVQNLPTHTHPRSLPPPRKESTIRSQRASNNNSGASLRCLGFPNTLKGSQKPSAHRTPPIAAGCCWLLRALHTVPSHRSQLKWPFSTVQSLPHFPETPQGPGKAQCGPEPLPHQAVTSPGCPLGSHCWAECLCGLDTTWAFHREVSWECRRAEASWYKHAEIATSEAQRGRNLYRVPRLAKGGARL